jgi:hypothetical protein
MIEIHDGIYYFRSDLFQPYEDIPINGLKVMQCINLIKNNLEVIKTKYNGVIGTASSVYSPQGIIVARVAKEFGLKSVLIIGNTSTLEKCIKKHRNLQLAKDLGCDIRIGSKLGYNNALYAVLHKLPVFPVHFGMDNVFVDESMRSIPEVDDIIIPCGSGISTISILIGLCKFHKLPKKIYIIQIAGYDRMKTIASKVNFHIGRKLEIVDFLYNGRAEVIFIPDKTFPYIKWIEDVGEPFPMDGRYELKAWLYFKENILDKNRKQLFYIIANNKGVL